MPPAAGVATMGRGGAFALKSTETGGTVKYFPMSSFTPYIDRGSGLNDTVNNTGFGVNKMQGLALCRFGLVVPMIVGVQDADFFTRAFGSTMGDTDASNYHTLTNWTDGNGSTPDVYALSKFGSISSSFSWDPNAVVSAINLSMGGYAIDPESGTTAALTAPSSGALSTGNAMGAAQALLTGPSEYVGFGFSVSTGLGVSKGRRAGTNSKYPVLCKGLLMSGQGGQVSVTQHRNATTVIGADGSDGTITLSIGTTGAGVALAFAVSPLGIGKPSNLGPNYRVHTYFLKSVDGTTAPFTATAM